MKKKGAGTQYVPAPFLYEGLTQVVC